MRIRPSGALLVTTLFGAVVLTSAGGTDTRVASGAYETAAQARPRWVRPATAKRVQPPRGLPADHSAAYTLAAAYYDTRGNWESRLTLNNKGADQIRPRVTLFARDGGPYVIPDVIVPGDDFVELDLNAIVAGLGGPFQQGSVQVIYYGKELEMGAQVVIGDLDRGMQFDEQLSYQGAGGENRREAVWWLPGPGATLALVLTNRTAEPVTVRAQLHGATRGTEDGPPDRRERRVQVRLEPHEVQVLDMGAGEGGAQALGRFGGLTVEFDGPPGALMARGFVEDMQSGYAVPITFARPAGKSPFYHGGGARMVDGSGALAPVVLARNTSALGTTVNGRLVVSRAGGLVEAFALASRSLDAGETAVIDLGAAWSQAQQIADATGVGVEFEYASAPGTVVMSAMTTSSDLSRTYQVPLIDPETPPSSTGGYPWRAAVGQTTVVYLKNTTLTPERYLLQITWPGGAWAPGLQELAPGETLALDIARLRDEQVPDAFGRTIAPDAVGGQVHWSIKSRTRHAIIGRAEHVDDAHGVSASYACINCCPDNVRYNWMDPDPLVVPVGSPVPLTAMLEDEDCYQSPLQPYSLPWNDLNWTIGNTSIATGDAGNEEVTGQGEGWTTFSADYDDTYWEAQPDGDLWYCADEPLELDFDAFLQVQIPYPTDFRQSPYASPNPYVNNSPPYLRWSYSWGSSVGGENAYQNLTNCEIWEEVLYSPSSFPVPPFAGQPSSPQPGKLANAVDGGLTDNHTTAMPFGSLSTQTVVGTQTYYYSCSNIQNGQLQYLWGPHGITRRIYEVASSWFFRVTKHDWSAECTLNPSTGHCQ
jgi:hypothetical protein